jgi:bacillolysin
MKKVKSVLLLALLFAFISNIINGQSAFDIKKKSIYNNGTVATSLNAKSIKASNNAVSTTRNNLLIFTGNGKTSQPAQQTKTAPQKIVVSSKTNLPIFIETEDFQAKSLNASEQSVKDRTFQFLNQLKGVLKIENPDQLFVISKINCDANGLSHVRLNQVYKGVKVYGSESVVHFGVAGNKNIFNGRYCLLSEDIDTTPGITEEKAVNIAAGQLSSRNKKISTVNDENMLSKLEIPVSELVIYKPDFAPKGYSLAYHITLFSTDHHRWEYFVDAHSGKVLHFIENTCSADGPKTANANDLNGVSRTINTYQVGSYYYFLDASRAMFNSSASTLPDEPVGAIVTIDMNNTYGDNQSFKYIVTNNNVWNNPTAVSAHYNAGMAYEYYRQKHNRNSIDGNGGTIMSIINVPDIETGEPLDNAFWNGKFMCYGNGDVAFYPLAGGLDVAGHEMTHGVVENTAALEYEGESGAINESMADIFGSMMDSEDWLIGEDVVKLSAFPSGALRSMSDPHNGGSSLSDMGYQPKIMSEKYTGTEDNSGVHINSGICNYAFYLYATAIGKEKAAAVYYKALDDYLTKSSQFIDLRLAVIQSAKDLYGESSNEVTQAGTAFDAVGITDGQGSNNDNTLPENNGEEYVLVYNTDGSDANTLYRSSLDQSVVDPLSTTEFLSRPSVTDDGSYGIFVAGDKTLHALVTTPGNDPNEFVLQEETIWSNAVISKDGKRLAAVTTYIDTAIYVYDFGSETWVKYMLYNPTYTDGVTSAGPQYADALEFDYTGEYLVYDCFNSLSNSDGSNIEYWDVNFIRIWDNTADDFGDGEVFKLFSSLPDKVSIGDPSFSKNSTNIIAFDYFSSDPEEYHILGCNIETNEVNTLINNTSLGWPSFNKDDSRLAFSSINLNDEPEIDYVLLGEDKITTQGDVQSMFTQAKWPVYFSTGIREESSVPYIKNSNGISVFPNPFTDNVKLFIPKSVSETSTIDIINLSGQKIYSINGTHVGNGVLELNLNFLNPGVYYLRVNNSKSIEVVKLIKSN